MNSLVSVITPISRPDELPQLMAMFFAQDYYHKELILVSDTGLSFDCVMNECRVSFLSTEFSMPKQTIGNKRNIAISTAFGHVIIHMDSDDKYSPQWISKSVDFLKNSNFNLIGLSKAYFYDINKKIKYLYNYTGGQKSVCGASMCFYKSEWEKHHFKDLMIGEDSEFCSQTLKIGYSPYSDDFLAIRHGDNTCKLNPNSVSFSQTTYQHPLI